MINQDALSRSFEAAFSKKRLSRYTATLESTEKENLHTLSSYVRNIKLSETFYPLLHILEVTLRNSLHIAISNTHHNEHWFDDASLLDRREIFSVQEIKNKLSSKKSNVSADDIVAELTFGFWTSLFDLRYEHHQTLWPHLLKPVFPNIPKGLRTRHFISKQLNKIRTLRNRIFHYEPVSHWKDLSHQHQSIIDVIGWLSPFAKVMAESVDDFSSVFAENPLDYANDIMNRFFLSQKPSE